MPRSAASIDGRYTEEQVLQAVHADVGRRPDVRLEVYDRAGNLRDDLEPVVKECRIEFSAGRLINGSMSLVMEPLPALRDALFQFVLSPVVGIGPMPDGGVAEHRWGRYLWPRPTTDTLGVASTNVEDWSVTCGDLNHLLNMNGPGRLGFSARQGQPVTSGLIFMLFQSGETDISRIALSDELLTETVSWSMGAGPRASRRLTDQEFAQALAAWSALINTLVNARRNPDNKVASDPEKPTRVAIRDLQDRGVRWLDVAETLHTLVGYASPYRDMEGRYVARPAPDPSNDTPTITYRTDQSAVVAGPLNVQPDYSGIANAVYVVGTSNANINPASVVGVADLNQLLPLHPLAQRNCGVRIEDVIEASQPLSQQAADAQARSELYASLTGIETIRFETPLNPQHEGFELVGLQVDGHAELDNAQITVESDFAADLMRGRMSHSVTRAFRPL